MNTEVCFSLLFSTNGIIIKLFSGKYLLQFIISVRSMQTHFKSITWFHFVSTSDKVILYHVHTHSHPVTYAPSPSLWMFTCKNKGICAILVHYMSCLAPTVVNKYNYKKKYLDIIFGEFWGFCPLKRARASTNQPPQLRLCSRQMFTAFLIETEL